MSRANYGTVEVEIGGETHELKPTLKAMDKIQNRWPQGGLRGAIDASSGLGARDLAFIIAAGTGMGQREAKDLPEAIFAEGTIHVAAPVIEYLSLLINPTGREDSQDAEEETEGE